MKQRKLNIDTADIQALVGCSYRQACRLMNEVREKCHKGKHDLITTTDLAFAFHCSKEELDKYFFGQ